MTQSKPSSFANASSTFLTTHWTRVLQAQGNSTDAKAALSELCAGYYAPVFAFVRRWTNDEEAARDLTQEFFARLLARNGIDNADRQRGRFRSYLLGAVKHFLSDARDRDKRLKRGGGQQIQSLNAATETSTSVQLPDPNAVSPEHEFDRKWALTVLERALCLLQHEHNSNEKVFEVLKPWLTGDTDNLRQADAARELEMNEAAVKVAIHRLRRRFREIIKKEVGDTLNDPAHVEQELQHLISALGTGR
ncbi:MAG: RNA polymerase sigma factor [Limisphaerales bacterium]